ncbi:MAG: zinc-finger domain-containing protein [Gammaproteobacteria bacterium]|nr:MAG: zinc-finger domain-containing protein [Gammaproteobacteria bacterium]
MPNPNTATQQGLNTPNARERYEVSRDDMPVHCPMPGSSLWNSHPQVFIAFDGKGHGKCPYCGAEYQLKS